MTDPLRLLGVAVDVGVAAAEYVASLRPAGRVDVASTKSSPTDPVTEIDQASETFIRERLLAARPDDGIIGEEGDDHRGSSGIDWLVDPIDGTVNFIYGIPQYAVSLAAVQDATAVAGFVINIATGERWGAARGVGAWRSTGGERERLTTPRPPEGLAHAMVATGFNYVPETRARQAAAVAALLPQVRDIRRFGSAALDLCALASGRLDAYVEQGLQPWDLAAGVLIAREAGCDVRGLEGDEPDNRLVIAAIPGIAEEFFRAIRDCGF